MENTKNKYGIIADMSLLLVAIIWGSGFIVIKNALDYMDPLYMLAIRFSMGSILLGLIFHKRLAKAKLEDFKAGLIIGIFLFVAFFTQTVGMQYTTASKSAFITASNVVMVPFIYWMISKEKPGIYEIIAAILCLVGLGILSIEGSMGMNMGDMLTLVCAVFFGLHIISIGKYSRNHDPIVLTVIQFAVSAILSIIMGLVLKAEMGGIPRQVGVSIVYLILANTILAFTIQNTAQKYTTSSRAAIILSLESVFGAIFSVLFMKEKITVRLVLGSIIVLFAIITAETKLEFLKPELKAESEEGTIILEKD